MLLISCPVCGPRPGSEFAWHAEGKRRPDPGSVTPGEWRVYLYEHGNEADWVVERWSHRSGCRTWLRVERHTVTNEIRSVSVLGEEAG